MSGEWLKSAVAWPRFRRKPTPIGRLVDGEACIVGTIASGRVIPSPMTLRDSVWFKVSNRSGGVHEHFGVSFTIVDGSGRAVVPGLDLVAVKNAHSKTSSDREQKVRAAIRLGHRLDTVVELFSYVEQILCVGDVVEVRGVGSWQAAADGADRMDQLRGATPSDFVFHHDRKYGGLRVRRIA